jgi:UDP-glucose 4-epimerase
MSVDTVLVTGTFGQIGKRCIEILLDRGRTVVGRRIECERGLPAADEVDAARQPPAHGRRP